MFSQFVYEVRAVHCANRNLVSSRVGLRNGPYVGGADGGWESVTGSHRHLAVSQFDNLPPPNRVVEATRHRRCQGLSLPRFGGFTTFKEFLTLEQMLPRHARGKKAMKDRSMKQHRNYAAIRVCTAIDRFLAAASDAERERTNKWVLVWQKRLAMLRETGVVPRNKGDIEFRP